jgi:hypothetical protein
MLTLLLLVAIVLQAGVLQGRLGLGDELGGGLGLVPLAERVRSAGAGLELRGFLQQARDALHFEFDCAGGNAPVVFAAHDVDLTMRGCGWRCHGRRITG